MGQAFQGCFSFISFVATIHAAHAPDGSVEFVYGTAAGLLVVAINILSYDNQVRFLLQIHQGMMGGVGLILCNQLPAPVIPAPDEVRIGQKGPAGGQLFGPVLAP